MKHSCLNFFYEIVNKISTKVKRNWNLKNLPRLKGCRMGRSDKVSLWYVTLLINTRFRLFILE